jgi:Domain of unknown function (DUF4399)
MTTRHLISLVMVLGMVAALLIACGGPAPQPPAGSNPDGAVNAPGTATPPPEATPEKINVEVGPNEPQIFMLEPQDGSSLESPFFLRVGVSNLAIPISYVKIHVSVDKACTPAGQIIPDDDQHLSLPLGVMENARFNLPLGQHRLCLQASNQNDIALEGPGMMRMIDVTIQAVDEPGNS